MLRFVVFVILPEILGKGYGENTFCKKGFPRESPTIIKKNGY